MGSKIIVAVLSVCTNIIFLVITHSLLRTTVAVQMSVTSETDVAFLVLGKYFVGQNITCF
jgi:hypothetical protein